MNKPIAPGRFGIYDTKDGLWIGNDNKPLVYDDLALARVAAQMAEDMVFDSDMGCRYVAKEIPQGNWRKRDDLKANRTPLESLRRLENAPEPEPTDNGNQRDPIVLSWDQANKKWEG